MFTWLLTMATYKLVMIISCKEWKTVEYYLGASQFNKAQAIKKTVCISY